jgi:hypothetical protein
MSPAVINSQLVFELGCNWVGVVLSGLLPPPQAHKVAAVSNVTHAQRSLLERIKVLNACMGNPFLGLYWLLIV